MAVEATACVRHRLRHGRADTDSPLGEAKNRKLAKRNSFSVWTATVFAFLFTGTVGWLTTVLQSAVEPVYYMALAMAFPAAGIYGALIATSSYLITVPIVGLWRFLHTRSFNYLVLGSTWRVSGDEAGPVLDQRG